MKRLIFLLATSCFAATTNSATIYDIDNTLQTNRVNKLARVFAKGEIANFPQPLVGGVLVTGTNWQCTVRNRWDDGSVKFAVCYFVATIPQNGNIVVTFQNNPATGNNTGFLTQSQMVGFNGGSWGGQILVTANGVTVTSDAKVMLGQTDPAVTAQIGSSTWPDGSNNYLIQGPLVTQVLVEDATSTTTNDFGWHWTSSTSTMAGPGGAGTVYTGNCGGASPCYASLHPQFVLTFYPTLNVVQVESNLEDDWSTRNQDQLYDWVIKTGAALSTVYSRTGSRRLTDVTVNNGSATLTSATANWVGTDVGMNVMLGNYWPGVICSVTNATTAQMCDKETAFVSGANQTVSVGLHSAFTKRHKVFWSGTAQKNVRIDHNFAYLISTRAIPNYDLNVKVNTQQAPGYRLFATTDMSDIGGLGMNSEWGPGWSNNHEGANLQREDLLYLWNMNNATSFDGLGCGDANSNCAQAYQILTGILGTIDTNMANGPQQPSTLSSPQAGNGYALTGLAGTWYGTQNWPLHVRESRIVASGNQHTGNVSSNNYYCTTFADKNTLNNSTSCGTGVGNATGKTLSRHTHTDGQFLSFGVNVSIGSQIGPPMGTNLDSGHLLEYSYLSYLLEGDYFLLEEAWHVGSWAIWQAAPGDIFSTIQSLAGGPRYLGWPLQAVGHAAFISPDGSPPNLYFTSVLNQNVSEQEGVYQVTGTPLTPSVTNNACSSFNSSASNPWDYGRCHIYSLCNSGPCTSLTNFLHDPSAGACPTNAAYGSIATMTAGNPTDLTLTPAVTIGSQTLTNSGSPFCIQGVTGGSFATATFNSVLGSISTGVNGCYFPTFISSTHITIPVNTTGFGVPGLGSSSYLGESSGLTQLRYPTGGQSGYQDWQAWGFGIALSHIGEAQTQIQGAAKASQKRIVEEMLDTGFVPYMSANYITSNKPNAGTCSGSGTLATTPYNTWSQALAQFPLPLQQYHSYITTSTSAAITGNFACADHGYSLTTRALVSYAQGYGTDSAEANCPGGLCTATAAWNFVGVNGYTAGNGGVVPYFGNKAYQDDPASCSVGNMGTQIKFALSPRVPPPPSGTGGVTITGSVTVTGGVTVQ